MSSAWPVTNIYVLPNCMHACTLLCNPGQTQTRRACLRAWFHVDQVTCSRLQETLVQKGSSSLTLRSSKITRWAFMSDIGGCHHVPNGWIEESTTGGFSYTSFFAYNSKSSVHESSVSSTCCGSWVVRFTKTKWSSFLFLLFFNIYSWRRGYIGEGKFVWKMLSVEESSKRMPGVS